MKSQEVTDPSRLPLAQVIATVADVAEWMMYLLQLGAHINLKSLLTLFQVNNLGGTLWQPKCHSITSVNDLERPGRYQAWKFGGSKLPRDHVQEHS